MSNNKQSSVESLFYKMVQSFELFESKQLTYQEYVKEILQHKEKAKAMHREEHGKTWDESMDNFIARGENYVRANVDFDDYYAETYGGKNEQQ